MQRVGDAGGARGPRASRPAKSAPNSATPTEPPSERNRFADAVAMPRSRRSTAFWIATRQHLRDHPEADAEHDQQQRDGRARRGRVHPREQEQADRHQRQPGDRERLVAAGAGDHAARRPRCSRSPPSSSGSSSRPELGRARAGDDLQVDRHEDDRPRRTRSVVRNSAAETTSNTGSRNRRSGRIGSGARRSWATNATSSATAPTAEPDDLGRVPRVLAPAPGGDEQQRRSAPPASSAAPSVVDPRAARARPAGAARVDDQRERDGADRQVDVEDPAPREVVGEQRRRAAARRRSRARRPSGCSPGSGRARAARRCRRRSPSRASSARRRRGPAARGSAISCAERPARRRSARSRPGRRRSRPGTARLRP